MIRIIATCLAMFVASTAAADTFEAAAGGAMRVRRIAGVVWALTAPCDHGTDLEQRQCRVVRDARVKTLTGARLLVDAEPGTLEVTPWSAATRSVSVRLSSCIRCAGVTIDGRTWYVTGAPPRSEGEKLETDALYDNARRFANEASANKYVATIKHARAQLLVNVPDKRRWQVSGKDGLLLEILGYRVVTPCTGEVLLASPTSSNVAPDKGACAAGAATAPATP